MNLGLLFWGFQDLNLVSEVCKKIRYFLNIKDFYIQILDTEKTISLMDVYPEEIIRTKCDLNNLYLWLSRNNKKDIFIIIDLFNVLFLENFSDNCVPLKKILGLNYKFCFVAPKILYPQNIKFLNNHELSSIHLTTIEYTRNNKILYEIIVNSKSNSQIIAIPIPEVFIVNRETYSLFKNKKKYIFNLFPKILKKFSACYIAQNEFTLKLVEMISDFISDKSDKVILHEIEANCTKNYINNYKDIFTKLEFPVSVSLEHFFKIKSSTAELKYILWLMYLSICEFETQTEKVSLEPKLGELFFST